MLRGRCFCLKVLTVPRHAATEAACGSFLFVGGFEIAVHPDFASNVVIEIWVSNKSDLFRR